MGSTTGESTLSGGRNWAFALLLLIDFVIVLVMLFTDQNLQTDFGGSAKYYSHWYGLLAEGLVDLVGAVVLVALVAAPAMKGRPVSSRRWLVLGGVVWSLVAFLANVAIVETYSQVGFRSASEFAKYLFGVTPYPGALSYIPWLYDLLLAAYVVTLIVGAMAAMRVRAPAGASSPSA
jgi:hypothetical protein